MKNPTNILMIVVLIGLFYALFFLPQRRQQKKRADMVKQLRPGTKVLTAGGIYGVIMQTENDVLVVKVSQDVEFEMDSRAIIRVVEPAPESVTIES